MLSITVTIIYPDNMEELQRRAADLLSSILIKKLDKEEIDTLVHILKDDSKNITW